jgi:hypothetical protein
MKILSAVVVSWLALATYTQWALANIVLDVSPPSQSVSVGSPVNIEIGISGLGNPPSLGVFDLNLGFDPTILSFNNVAFGDPILGIDELDPTGAGNTLNFSNPGSGTVEIFDLSLDDSATLSSLQPSNFTLATLTFNTVGTGTSSLDLIINSLGDADGNPLSADLQNGSIAVSAVSAAPEPNLTLVLLGLIACLVSVRLLRLSR